MPNNTGDYSPLESQIDIAFDAWCDCCAEYFSISHDDNSNFLSWVKREANSARQIGWTETETKVFCPNCNESDFKELQFRKKVVDVKKAREAVLSATRKTWIEKLKAFLQSSPG